MAKYRGALPQLSNDVFLTDGGIETVLIFRDGIDLPEFAAFTLFDDDDGTEALRRYFRRFTDVGRAAGAGFVGESATWRASRDWGDKLGYDAAALERANRAAIEMLTDLRDEYEEGGSPFVVSGCIGPRDDAYDPSRLIEADEAQRYHAEQVATFRDTDADLVTAITMTHVGEAIGITRANASRMSHAELDEAEELDDGDPAELGADFARLRARLERLSVLGGCCGTDERHVAEIARACLA